jgi:hypothetical protein
MSEAKDCSSYLGVYIAEKLLSNFFDHTTHMPLNNPGYDFVCGKGFKIDVKSSCYVIQGKSTPRWQFDIDRNQIADYFLCIAFNDRVSLNPLHVWLIPSQIVNDHLCFCVTDNPRGLSKWSNYERPIDKVVEQCNGMKQER